MKKILVIGGNGFVGSQICQRALDAGYTVLSLSRKGRPSYASWTDKVKWIQGSSLQHECYKEFIPELNAIVHTVGTLLDSNIPLVGNLVQGDTKEEKTYERTNRDTAIIPAQKLVEYSVENQTAPKKTFVFISAERGLPIAPKYLSTKREVEEFLQKSQEKGYFKSVILRPGFIYGESRQVTKVMAQALKVLNFQDFIWQKVGLSNIAEQIVPALPTQVEKLANAAVKACTDESMSGKIFNSAEIESMS